MTRPITLPPADPLARLMASALGQALSAADLLEDAAASWARLLERPVMAELLPPTLAGPPTPPRAQAGWLTATGEAGVLSVDTALLAGRLGVLAGARPRAIGPVPLSPAECGLFAYLATAWLGRLTPPLALDWIDGGAGLWQPARPAAAVRWRLTVDDAVGLAHWWVPATPPPATAPRPDLPLTARLVAGRAALAAVPRPGALVVLHAAPRLEVAERVHPLARRADRWHVVPLEEARMSQPISDLPLTVDAVVGRFTLTVGEASALAPGSVVPLAPDPLPEVRLMVGDQPIAVGVLVDDEGRAAVQITRVLDQSSSRI